MKIREDLLNKYFRGETSIEEEKQLKARLAGSSAESAEKDMFGYFQKAGSLPDNLEELIYSEIRKKQDKSKLLRFRLISVSSVAASVVIFLSIYLNVQNKKNTEMENNFLVMEKALFQVSESIQPKEQEEMLVLWVDNDIEIIIN